MAMDAVKSSMANMVGNAVINRTNNYPKVENVETSQTVKSATVTNEPKGKQTEGNSKNALGEEPGKENETASTRTIKQVVSDINRKLNNNTIARFGYHEDTNRVTIKIIDKDTEDVIKEIPPEKTLDLIAKAWELAGILVDEKK